MTARLVIAASRSGEGKTTLALGLIGALRRRLSAVAAAKVGPDYLDTGWHRVASGRDVRNLDLWMMGETGVRASFAAGSRDADAVVIEGVMGLFDGHRRGDFATSTADVARTLEAPVLLVLDASRSAATLAAVADGLARFDERVNVIGVVLNRFREQRERLGVQRAFDRVGLPVLGWVPPLDSAGIDSRHLGLLLAEEAGEAARTVEAAADLVDRFVDVDRVLEAMRTAPPLAAEEMATARGEAVRIGVARDEAFAFYYADNLDMLEALGARLVPFSPLADAALPDDLDGLYLGGGYPELHAGRLSGNESMRRSVAGAIDGGMPVFAECGGMLYLLDELADATGCVFPMVGALHARAAMADRLQRVGYVEAALAADCVLGPVGESVRAHEFRYSTCEPIAGPSPAWLVNGEPVGFRTANVLASYLHLNFAGCPRVAEHFVDSCRAFAGTKPRRIA